MHDTQTWLNSSLPKFVILTSFHSEMMKVRKSTKNDFKWRVNISRRTAVKASKFCMILKLDLNNSFPKFGLLTIAQSTNCRLLKKSLNAYISKNWEATWLELTPLSLWCPCFLGTEFHVCSYYGYEYTMITMKSKKKKKFISSKLQKQRHQNFGCKLLGAWTYLAPNLVF